MTEFKHRTYGIEFSIEKKKILSEVPPHVIEKYGEDMILDLLTSFPGGEHGGIQFFYSLMNTGEMFMLYANGELVHVKNIGLLQ